ncbi:MAG: hypothetical protein JNL83_37565 [Myxococcales bacterium]|nr:hypothetical protein [Myxococcales bacterium]
MKRVIALVLVTIVACACPKKGGGGTANGSGQGSGSTALPPAQGCEAVRAQVEALYRAEAKAKEPTRVEEAVADNVAMVMAECAKAPDRISACIAQGRAPGAAEAQPWTAKDLEASCMPQLDDEGSEGDTLKK